VYTPETTAHQVYLLEGTWYHWHTGEQFAGKRFIIAPPPMDSILHYIPSPYLAKPRHC
jgi:alpha-glucosidase